jgi:hypothetical protein
MCIFRKQQESGSIAKIIAFINVEEDKKALGKIQQVAVITLDCAFVY